MMRLSLHGGWFMGTSCMVCVNNVAEVCAPTGAHLASATDMLQA